MIENVICELKSVHILNYGKYCHNCIIYNNMVWFSFVTGFLIS